MDFTVFTRLFQGTPKPMAGIIIHIKTPLPAVSYCYEIQRVADKLNLKGQIFLNMNGTLKLQLEGEQAKLKEFHLMLNQGKVVPKRLEMEAMWLPYKKQFPTLLVNVYHQILFSARSNEPGSQTYWRT